MPARGKIPALAKAATAIAVAVCVAGATAPALAQTAERSLPALPPIETLSETVERPLFRADRRPAAVEETPEEVEDAESGLFTLVGIIVAPTQRIALVKVRGSPEVLQLSEGQQANGWTVVQIRPEEVVFESDDKTETIELIDIKPSPPPRRPAKRERRPRPQNQSNEKKSNENKSNEQK